MVNDNIVIIHHLVATLLAATWQPCIPSLALMWLVLIDWVTWHCHIVAAVVDLGRWMWMMVVGGNDSETRVVRAW